MTSMKALRTKTSYMHDETKNILVIKLKYIGDVLVTTPVFESLRYYYPKAYIAALVNKGTEPMLTQNPAINKILVLERYANPVLDLIKYLQLINNLRKLHFDLVLELTNSDRGALLGFLSGAKRRLGFKSKKLKRFDRHLLFTDLVTARAGRHIVDYHLEMTEYLGCVSCEKELSLYWNKEDETACLQILREKGFLPHNNFIVLHPISQARYKAWHLDGYVAICDYLQKEWGIRTILICGNNRAELNFTNRIVEMSKSSPIHLGGQLSLKQLAALLSHAMFFIGIDSGPMHMATAVKTPVVAIFGPSKQFRWGPRGEGHKVVQKSWKCVPCGKKGCNGEGRSRCLDDLSIEEVVPVLKSRMDFTLSNKNRFKSVQ